MTILGQPRKVKKSEIIQINVQFIAEVHDLHKINTYLIAEIAKMQ